MTMNLLNPASLQVSLDVLYKISPLLILFITALFLLLIEVLIPSEEKLFSALMGIWGLALSTVASLRLWSEETEYLFQNSFSLDRF